MTNKPTSKGISAWHTASEWSKTGSATLLLGLVGIFGTAFGVYSYFAQEAKRAELSIALFQTVDILAEQSQGLRLGLALDGRPVDTSDGAPRIVLVRVWNSGEFPIRNVDFADGEPFGFELNGRVLAADVVDASNQYLSKTLSPRVENVGRVLLTPVTIEPGESMLVRLVTLKEMALDEHVVPFGKVAGIKEVTQRLTIWHPGGYVDSYPTPTAQLAKRILIAGATFMALVLLVVLRVRDRRQRRARNRSHSDA